MKVILKSIGVAYNEFGCGQRLQFLIIYNCKRWTQANYYKGDESINLNRRLNKLVDYWNIHGKHAPIRKMIVYTPFGNDDINEGMIEGWEKYYHRDNKITNPQVKSTK